MSKMNDKDLENITGGTDALTEKQRRDDQPSSTGAPRTGGLGNSDADDDVTETNTTDTTDTFSQ